MNYDQEDGDMSEGMGQWGGLFPDSGLAMIANTANDREGRAAAVGVALLVGGSHVKGTVISAEYWAIACANSAKNKHARGADILLRLIDAGKRQEVMSDADLDALMRDEVDDALAGRMSPFIHLEVDPLVHPELDREVVAEADTPDEPVLMRIRLSQVQGWYFLEV